MRPAIEGLSMTERGLDNRVNGSQTAYSDRIHVYEELTRLDIEDSQTRYDPKVIDRLLDLGMQSVNLNVYWQRISFVARNCRGRVLEVGCATGNVSKYIARNSAVEKILAVDIADGAVEFLRNLNLEKVETRNINLVTHELGADLRFDCVVLSEIIEHLTYNEESKLVDNLHSHLLEGATFIITTPIGFMPDPDHKRGFSRLTCTLHLQFLYGRIVERADNGIQQFFVVRHIKRRRWWRILDRALNFPYEIRVRFQSDSD